MATMTENTIKTLEEMTVAELRYEFTILRRNALYSATEAEWKDAVATIAYRLSDGEYPEAIEWVQAARRARTECPKCHGTGEYHRGGTHNGIPKFSGCCNRCEGKGEQNQDDYRRNFGYDRYAIASAYRAMINGAIVDE